MTTDPIQPAGPGDRAPAAVVFGIAAIAAAMLQLEVLVSRLFSVLFYYHYSFFAVSIVMAGLTFGGLISAIMARRSSPELVADRCLGPAALIFAAGSALGTVLVIARSFHVDLMKYSIMDVWPLALAYLPALTAAGFFLATVFARWTKDLSRLYAWDLVFAAVAIVSMIFLARIWEGPVALFIPSLLAAIAAVALSRGLLRISSAAVALAVAAPVALAPFRAEPLIKLPPTYYHDPNNPPTPVLEHWNEHSRIQGVHHNNIPAVYMFIDKQAMTQMTELPMRKAGDPVPPLPDWLTRDIFISVHRTGRPNDRVAVIGVGGGQDLVMAVANGAKEVHGYELNRIFLDLLEKDRFEYSGGLAKWPEVKLFHGEARVTLATSGREYDVILASMIDTWAAISGGGMVLSENGLYTVEGWTEFLKRVSPRGVVSMTRWYYPKEPAEVQRLAIVAAEALENVGIQDPGQHILIIAQGSLEAARAGHLHDMSMANVIASRTAFTPDEIAAIEERLAKEPLPMHLAYPSPYFGQQFAGGIDPQTRRETIARSPFDISPTYDERPFFFLQYRFLDIVRAFTKQDVGPQEITLRPVRVLMVLVGLSVAFAAVILLVARFAFPVKAGASGIVGPMTLYFFGIGLGYILVQLGLLQRLIIILGHPTYAFSVILFTMLLSTGIGSALSGRVSDRGIPKMLLGVVAGLAVLLLLFPMIGKLSQVAAMAPRIAVAAAFPLVAGALLGFCFPLGMRLIAGTGEDTVQRLWAINGAAGVAGTSVAAMLGMMAGSRAVLAAGVACYLLVYAMGSLAARRRASGAA
jgi:hypothetical protein